MTTAPQLNGSTGESQALYLAFELGDRSWKLGFTTGHGQKPRERTVPARNLERLVQEIAQAKQRFGLAASVPVVSCYEAGRDGFWLHRWLVAHEIDNCIVDAAAIEVNRRQRRAKTDSMDVRKLLTMLMRYHQGEKKAWSVVSVPSVAEEDQRHLQRSISTLKKERTRSSNRINGLLATQGLRVSNLGKFPDQLDQLRLWDGSPVPIGLRQRLEGEYAHYDFVNRQLRDLNAERARATRQAETRNIEQVRQLMQLKGIGINGAWGFVMEFFSWRQFKNRREVGALAGLTPTPYQSGTSSRDQGVSKAGNRHVRALAVELAWCWVRFQPESPITKWFMERFHPGGSRSRRVGIVAVARKMLIELWRFLETGVLPEGVHLKSQGVQS